MASYGKVDAYSQQVGFMEQALVDTLRTTDELVESGIIPWIDIAPDTQYVYATVNSYGSQAPVAQGLSADVTHSNVIPTKTTKDLKATVVSFQFPEAFTVDPRLLQDQLSKKAYVLARTWATRLGSTGVESDTNFGGLGSFCAHASAQTVSAHDTSVSGALTIAKLRATVDAVIPKAGGIVMAKRTRRSLLAAIEALNYQPDYQKFGGPGQGDGALRLHFDGTPVFVNDYLPIDLTVLPAGNGAMTRVYAINFDPVDGFMGFYAGQLARTKLAADSDSPQDNFFMYYHNNFVLKNTLGMAQLVGVTD